MFGVRKKKRRRKITFSQGERHCQAELKEMQVNPLRQRVVSPLPNYRFDFAFSFLGRPYLLEYDGEQHFTYIKFIQRKQSSFTKSRQRDILKTVVALLLGFNVIRLDGPSIGENYKHAIHTALSSGQRLYVSHPERYQWLLQHEVSEDIIRQYSPSPDAIIRSFPSSGPVSST